MAETAAAVRELSAIPGLPGPMMRAAGVMTHADEVDDRDGREVLVFSLSPSSSFSVGREDFVDAAWDEDLIFGRALRISTAGGVLLVQDCGAA
jgi:hypothetical protein